MWSIGLQGAYFFCQLWHAGRISHPSLQPGGAFGRLGLQRSAADGEVFYLCRATAICNAPRS